MLRPILELILAAVRIIEVTIEIARGRADRPHHLIVFVAAHALVGVGNHVLDLAFLAMLVDPVHFLVGADDAQFRLGLLVIPDIGEPLPSLGMPCRRRVSINRRPLAGSRSSNG